MQISVETSISKPAEVVFPWIADPEKAVQWQQDVKDWAYLVKTPQVVGTKFIETIQEGGSALEMSGEITQYVQDKLIAFHLASRIHKLDVAYVLEEGGQGVVLRIHADVHWKFPMNVISLFGGGKIRRSMEGQLFGESQQLKQLCEAGAAS